MTKLTVVYWEHYPEKENQIHCISGEYESVIFMDGELDIDGEELLDTNPDEYNCYDCIVFLEIDGLVLIGDRSEWAGGDEDDRQREGSSDGGVSGGAAAG